MFQAEGTVLTKAPRQEAAWHVQGGGGVGSRLLRSDGSGCRSKAAPRRPQNGRQTADLSCSLKREVTKSFHEVAGPHHMVFPGQSRESGKETGPSVQAFLVLGKS